MKSAIEKTGGEPDNRTIKNKRNVWANSNAPSFTNRETFTHTVFELKTMWGKINSMPPAPAAPPAPRAPPPRASSWARRVAGGRGPCSACTARLCAGAPSSATRAPAPARQPNRVCGQFVTFCAISGGAQALLNAIQEFELWCGLKVNRKKTCTMVIERLGAGQRQLRETLVYMGQAVTFLSPSK
jgi:hypothetical protein